MNKAPKIHQQPESRAWLQGHDCAEWQNYKDTKVYDTNVFHKYTMAV